MKLKELLIKYREILSYIFWGVATTVVNYVVYFSCTQLLQINYLTSNVLSWAAAVIFAFFTNKAFVFSANSWKLHVLFSEFWRFVSGRVLSGAVETLLLFVFVDLINLNDGLVKIAIGVVVVLLNYVLSKLLVFTKTKKD